MGVGPADLDNVGEFVALGLEGVLETAEGRQETFMGLDDGGDVHGGGEGVVGGLALIDMVIGMHHSAIV